MSEAIYSCIDKYVVCAGCAEPMHVGGGSEKEEILLHPADGLPFIQATGICGAFRDYCSGIFGEETAELLFGSTEKNSESKVRFTDGLFEENDGLRIEIRPHVRISRASGTASDAEVGGVSQMKSGQKFDMHYVGAGAEFCFSVYLYDAEEEEKKVLETCLSALNRGEILLGGLKSSGCGDVRLKKVMHRHYNMKKPADRKAWIRELPEDAGEDLLEKLPELEAKQYLGAYSIVVTAETEGELLVKGISVEKFGDDAPKAVNIKNARGQYLVPGSSIRGSVRSRMEIIAGYMGLDSKIISDAFGSASGEDGKPGNLRFRDIIVDGKNIENDGLHTRIHIDKFTGGVMNGGLFTELNVFGDLEMHMEVGNKNDPQAVAGLLLFALRDLGAGLYALGGGENVGKGYVKIREILVKDLQTGAECRFDENRKLTGDKIIVEQCMESLKCRQEEQG